MKKTFSSKKSAFSLIELSIVLIIIGLLIAGITGGASLIKSSELRSIMGEARGYAVAVNSFFTQYDQYPGDTSTIVGSNSALTGDRDNQIEFVNNASTLMAEGIDAWYDLKDIGAIDLALTLPTMTSPEPLVPVTNIPGSKIKGAGWVFDYNSTTLQNVVVLTGTTSTWVANGSMVNGTSAAINDITKNLSTEIISAPDSLSIDSKIDDGKANSGNIQAVNQSTTSGSECVDGTTPSLYKVSNGAKKVCAMSFRVDVSS